MKFMQKTVAAVISILFAFCMLPCVAFAQDAGLTAASLGDEGGADAGSSYVVTSVYTADGDGDLVEAENIGDAVEAASQEGATAAADAAVSLTADTLNLDAQSQQDDGFVVVIDPGHGGYDGGAGGYVVEKTVNLTIAMYCKAKLEQYPGITVYMTRTDDTYVKLSDRVQCAIDHKADLLLCLHNNSSDSGQASGAEVIVPRNGNWFREITYETGWELGAKIMEKLNALGIGTHNGVWSRTNTEEATYPDGTPCDYYTIIKGARSAGILGIIVEHAFVNNATDAKFLTSDEALKALGEADADAVIEYYNNSKALERIYWPIYDYGYYTQNNADALASTDGSLLQVLGYFKNTGMAQSQRANLLFDVQYYKAKYADLQAAFGDDLSMYYHHFIEYGLKEGRQASEDLWLAAYKANYADLQAAFGDNWKLYYNHYFEYGINEGRVANRMLDASDEPTPTPTVQAVDMYRLYNPNNGEHFYTVQNEECDALVNLGWTYEGTAWVGPSTSNSPVYRLYNPYAGDHHYTLDPSERDYLVQVGWIDEGIGWYSDDNQTLPLYRLYNPNAVTGTHHYTTSLDESNELVAQGWIYEGISWYCESEGVPVISVPPGTPIMGESLTMPEQMVRRYNSMGKTYPSDVYAQYGAATIVDFCLILYEEAQMEGVRAEVVFAQAMHETGWLQFGGDVKAEQCNFCGLGATGGVPGCSFNTYGTNSVRMGLRAQIQHLKAYASTDPLVNELIDPRFYYVSRGRAPVVEDLAGTWASSTWYSNSIIQEVNALLSA